ncbi:MULTISPECIES: nickel-responsive transcriptional regulator NikR [unclassified Halorhabdus]|uniref:nickel-responsive transcriptional regulator NikR n=1 Tax=unclassified Halorhabdus TaxID=2621901 RepID=UPI0023D9C4B8|nr:MULTISPECIES: nickel-responsive transcriptional regulator NikR [unclassified Halorhabdus]WEL17656.1 Transcriptional regulator, CopG/Arc/MetJ family (DNA-binding and a metal-binding domains) [Halorhabdus sp. SVX81]WEL21535.1 Transcriptional regulator, CopG/Arc/MetJ family (DNA-binding and a metal-binding domains) [Halorhabdus sp. BNX81]
MADDLDRVSLTLPPEMTDRLDGIVADWNYGSRSEAVRDALRDFFTTYEWEGGDETRHYGTIVIAHEHDHDSDVASRLQTIQHEYADVVTSVQHIHLSEDRCMETLVVDGTAGQIDELANRLRALAGVKQVKVVVVGGDADSGDGHEHDQGSRRPDHGHEH